MEKLRVRIRVRNFVGLRFGKFRVLFHVKFGSWDPSDHFADYVLD